MQVTGDSEAVILKVASAEGTDWVLLADRAGTTRRVGDHETAAVACLVRHGPDTGASVLLEARDSR